MGRHVPPFRYRLPRHRARITTTPQYKIPAREFGHHLIIYSAPLLIMFVAWHLNQRLITALTEAERRNVDLEGPVAANRLELEKSYLHMYALEQERTEAEVRW